MYKFMPSGRPSTAVSLTNFSCSINTHHSGNRAHRYGCTNTFINLQRTRKSIKQRIKASVSPISSSSTTQLTAIENGILDRYWEARGVVSEEQRTRLVSIANSTPPLSVDAAALPFTGNLSLLTANFVVDNDTEAQIHELSRRLLSLNSALGGLERSVDVVWMVIREPQLLLSDPSFIIQRLLELRTSEAAAGMDIGRVVEAQPGLLLQQSTSTSNETETASEQREAWQHGLLSDGTEEWNRRLSQLEEYKALHGDAHVGFRDDDDPELSRWANKQRKAFKRDELEGKKFEMLQTVGFEFDGEKAEWLRWYNELVAFRDANGHSTPATLSLSADSYYLINWASIQRIARRSKRLTDERIQWLDDIDFDWSGADPLS